MPGLIKMHIGNYSPVAKQTRPRPSSRAPPCRGFTGSIIGRIHNARAGCGCGK